MTTSKQTHNDLSITLRVLARLLQYPDADNRAHLQEMRAALHGTCGGSA